MKLGHPINKEEFIKHLVDFNGFKQISSNNLLYISSLDVIIVSINDKMIYTYLEGAPGAENMVSQHYEAIKLPKDEKGWTDAIQIVLNLF